MGEIAAIDSWQETGFTLPEIEALIADQPRYDETQGLPEPVPA